MLHFLALLILGMKMILHTFTILVETFHGTSLPPKIIRQFSNAHFLIEQGLLKDSTTIFDPAPIEKLLREKIHSNNLRNGIELWVTVFPSLKIPGLGYDWLVDFVRARTGTDAHWLCVQDFKDDETLYNLLLASAALPLAFPSREVNGKSYVDGGLADNVPLKALAARGCTHAIIIHLNNGVTWNRHDFREQTIIEIRPEQPINKSEMPIIGLIDSWLDFSFERITELKQGGYEDAKRCLNPIIESFRIIQEQRQTHDKLVNSTQQLLNDPPL
jgi:NTE family protein